MKDKILNLIAFISRSTPYFKGKKRIIRSFYPTENIKSCYDRIVNYDKDLKILVNPCSFIEWEIFFFAYYEKHVIDIIKKYLKPGVVFVDVGANIGCHSLVASKIASKVIAVEPEPNVRNRLIENIKLNSIKNIIVYDYAISDYIGKAIFYPPKNNQSNKVLGSLSFREQNEEIGFEVKVTSLDELLKNEPRIDFIKIDVEGHNREVILGAKNIIKKHNPKILYEVDGTDIIQFF
jgi:FkbM family methyltransferase